MNRKIFRSLAFIVLALGLGVSATYASFTSNSVMIAGNTLTTGQATLKLCDISGANSWDSSINPSLNLSQVIPNEERDLLLTREVYVGNDNGHLVGSAGSGKCTNYSNPAGGSSTPLRLLPNISFAPETCPDTLPSNIKLRFEINGMDTGYKTLNSWSSNATSFDPLLNPGGAATVKAFALLSAGTTNQQGSCTFTITFAGKQPASS